MTRSTNSVSWPQRFVYVCTATAGNIVNIAPMLNAGPGRVVGLLVLRAVNNLKKPTVIEKSNAILPGERLMRYGSRNIDLGPENMKFCNGKSDSFTDWVDVFATARNMAVRLDAEIVFNITGGPKPVVIGALLGAGTSGQNTPITTISFGHDAVPKKVYFDADGQMIEEVLPVDLHLTLDDYMKSVELVEINRSKRRKTESRMAKEKSLAENMFQITLKGKQKDARRIFAELYSSLWNLKYNGTTLRVPLHTEIRNYFADIFSDMRDTEITPDGISIGSAHDLGFLQGKWLESKVFNAVRDMFEGSTGIEIACELCFGVHSERGATDQSAEISEFDLVILGEDRLEIIEAKAAASTKQIHLAIAKLNNHKTRLGGDAGRAWIVAPLLDYQQLDNNDMIKNAEANGIRILFGRDGLVDLEREIRKSRRI
jgi:Card1-like, endonuclease domain